MTIIEKFKFWIHIKKISYFGCRLRPKEQQALIKLLRYDREKIMLFCPDTQEKIIDNQLIFLNKHLNKKELECFWNKIS